MRPPPFLRERALELHRAGDLAAAEPLYRLLLDAAPRDGEVLYLAALLRFQRGRHAEAVEGARRAARARPGDAAPHALAGLAEAGRGRPERAVSAYGRALALAPGRWDVLVNRAAALSALGRDADALADCDRALALEPEAPEAHGNRGDALGALGRLPEALAAYGVAAALGLAAAADRRAAALSGLAPPASAAALAEAAELLARGGVAEAALDAYGVALALAPCDPAILNGRAVLLAELGRLDEAVAALDRAVAAAPGEPVLFHNFGLFARFTPGHRHLGALAAIDPAGLDGRRAAYLRFARAKAAADLGDPDGAFAELAAGNALVRATFEHDPARHERLAERIRAAPAAGGWDEGAAGGGRARPVFVVGLPRSGSTLIERVLAGHSGVAAAGETDAFRAALAELRPSARDLDSVDDLAPGELRRLGEGYRARLPRLPAGTAAVVDKTLVNAWHVGLIRRALPDALFIHARRDPRDAGLSCFEQFFNTAQPFAYDLAEIGRYARALSAVLAHWRAVLPPGALLDLAYEDLVADPEGQARRLLAHCGLAFEPACLDLGRAGGRVGTASVAQVRRPVSGASVGRWRAYTRHLGPLLDALEPPR